MIERLQEEKRQEAVRRKERNEAHLYMTINVYTEDSFMGHKGNDLFDADRAVFKSFKVKKLCSLQEAVEIVADQLKYPASGIRIWPIISRANETQRPASMTYETERHRPISDVSEGISPYNVFMELIQPDSGVNTLPVIDPEGELPS